MEEFGLHMTRMIAGPRRKQNGSSWGLVGIVASAAAAWLFGAWQIGQNKAKKSRSDSSYLTQMLALPLKYTEHAQCRMDCRCSLCQCRILLKIQATWVNT